ncbi:MAG: hypothetical protein IJJ77_04515 [Paludibacteraceae bacterium]|nr:hypothetical protein [Paludibacteraceae bacterium]
MTKKLLTSLLLCASSALHAANYLTFTAAVDNSSFGLLDEGENYPFIQYSLDDGNTWDDMPYNTLILLEHKGDKAMLRGVNPKGFSKGWQKYTSFVMQRGAIAASGSVMSLIDGEGYSQDLPASFCFYRLFYACDGLIQAPELPAISLLTEWCYSDMFCKCTSLTKAPKLPALYLNEGCYAGMFMGCVNLVEAPELPASCVKEKSYQMMFQDCAKISKIKVNITQWGEIEPMTVIEEYREYEDFLIFPYAEDWLKGVSPHGTFICPDGLPEERGDDRIPQGWKIVKN